MRTSPFLLDNYQEPWHTLYMNYTRNNEVKEESKKVFAKKSLGQNFLQDKHFQNKIFEVSKDLYQNCLDGTSYNKPFDVIEIGPGRGDLTRLYQYIPTLDASFTLYEIDSDLIPNLQTEFPSATVIEQDFIDVIPTLTPHFLISNLPYYIGSRLIIDLIKYNKSYPFAFILQKEVACKTKKSESITFFGACLDLFYNTKVEFIIPPSAFVPAPKVHSALLSGDPKQAEAKKIKWDGAKSIRILKAMFFKPNKTLLNNLIFGKLAMDNNLEVPLEKEAILALLEKAKQDPGVRISWSNYRGIFEALYESLEN